MLTRILQWLAPPVFEGDEEKTNAAGLLNALLMITFAGAIVFPLTLWIVGDAVENPVDVIVAVLAVTTVILFALIRFGYVRLVGTLLSLILVGVFSIPMFLFAGMHDSAITGFFAAIIMSAIVAGWRTLLLISGLSILSVVAVFYAETAGLIEVSVPSPSMPDDLVLVVMMMAISALLLRYAVSRMSQTYERSRQNAEALEESNIELQASRDRMALQSRDLERRARYLEATSTIARDAASVLDLQELLGQVVVLISQQLGFYHTGVFMLEPSGEAAALQAASSEGGQRMLARGHRLVLGEGLVGSAAAKEEPRVALDVGEDAVFFDNPDLPDTHSEVALPLRARGRVIGVLDVQSIEPGAFSDEDVVALQTLADQVAVAISNAELFQQAQESLAAERSAYGELSESAWRALLQEQSDLSVLRDERGVSTVVGDGQPATRDAEKAGAATPGEHDPRKLVMPIRVRGRVIGAIDAYKPDEAGEWTPDQIALMETLGEQLGDALEDARLFQDARRRAIQEELIGDVTSRMRESLDMDSILRTAVREMHRVLGLAEAELRMGVDSLASPGMGATALHAGELGGDVGRGIHTPKDDG